ncbi:Riboflavin kinase / FMN adenylyltransferase [uncultured Candidatus Thioglobus sp.]|nr:Riboflavin kinase / FMN adenylyltransferase [uncultured Candidatus Thioglobus sp.]
MKIIRGLHNLKKHSGSVVTIGNFDGVHIGHQHIVNRLVKQSNLLGLPSVLISFSPTPQSFFAHEKATLSNFRQKHQLLEKSGLDVHLIIKFDREFSNMSADDFIQTILIDKLQMKFCLIGDDFRFGSGRAGDFKLLQDTSAQAGFKVENTQSIVCDDCRASSSTIRDLLAKGKVESAAKMMGHEFSISGKVMRGKQLGRTIDFPTINIPIKRNISPVLGVFAVQVDIIGQSFNGVCNIGKRPTVNGENILLEVFLFDFNQEVYGKLATVVFKQRIRDERKFDSFDALKAQIILDTQSAKTYFS